MRKSVIIITPILSTLFACSQADPVATKSENNQGEAVRLMSSANSTDNSKASSTDTSTATPRMDPKILGDGMARDAADKMVDHNKKLDKALKDVDGN